MNKNTHTSNGGQPRILGPAVLASLALLSAGGPLGTDMYLPSFVDISHELHTSPSSVQLTLSAFMVGMALGQLIMGSVSDSNGRKVPLIGGALLFIVSSVGCALAPSIGVLTVFRLLQGVAGGTSLVVARSVIPDIARGSEAASAFSILMAIQGLAPAIAPLLGGFLAPVVGWRGIFWIIAAFNVAMLLVAVFVVPETRRPEDRSSGALRNLFPSIGRCFTRRAFVGYTLAFSVGFGVLFSYISASPFVLQKQLGLPTHVYSITFAVNSLAIAFMSGVNGRLVQRFAVRNVLLTGLSTMLTCSVLLVVVALAGPWLWPTLVLLFIMTGSMGLMLGNATALGVETIRDIGTGAGSGAMGALQFLVAGIVSPLVGLGTNSALSMSVCMTVSGTIALLGCLALTPKAR